MPKASLTTARVCNFLVDEHSKAFFRAGKRDQWKDVLSEAQVARIVELQGEQMARFGYLPK